MRILWASIASRIEGYMKKCNYTRKDLVGVAKTLKTRLIDKEISELKKRVAELEKIKEEVASFYS